MADNPRLTVDSDAVQAHLRRLDEAVGRLVRGAEQQNDQHTERTRQVVRGLAR
ncbi:hypothetical protein ACWCQP_50425 [Streptomyces chartreusis]